MHESAPSTLRDYLDVLWRRKLIILQAVILVPVVAVVWSSRQESVYEASAGVLVNTQNVAANLSGVFDPSVANAPRVLKTQLELARVPEVARRAVARAGVEGWTGDGLLGASRVTATEDSDVMTFTARAGERATAIELVNEYAREFTRYRLELDTDALDTATAAVEQRLRRLEADGRENTPLYASMLDRRDSLETLRALQPARARVVKEAAGASQVEPDPTQAGVIGLVLGIALGFGLAFLREALDTRIRSVREIADRLHMPLLGRLPRPPQAARQPPRLVTVSDPYGPHAESFRMLMSNIDLVNLEHDAESIMVTSAVEQEGKSTTAANLAVAFARAGKRVILVDFDLRNRWIHRFFGLVEAPGITELAAGDTTIEEALQSVDVAVPASLSAPGADGANGSGATLQVIPPGASVRDPAWIVGSAFGAILEEVRHRSDLVIVDGPPLLLTGDAVEASARVDALLVVTRLNHIRGPMLDEVERILGQSPAIKLGFVATDAEPEGGYGYGYPAAATTAWRPLRRVVPGAGSRAHDP